MMGRWGAAAVGATAFLGVLWATGPGTIFPIAIVVGWIVIAVAVVSGAGFGWLTAEAWRRLSGWRHA